SPPPHHNIGSRSALFYIYFFPFIILVLLLQSSIIFSISSSAISNHNARHPDQAICQGTYDYVGVLSPTTRTLDHLTMTTSSQCSSSTHVKTMGDTFHILWLIPNPSEPQGAPGHRPPRPNPQAR